jgi:phosphatidylglycerophosphate synthase
MSDISRKLPENLACPIDNLILNYGNKPYFIYRKLNMTPNDLTSISLIFGLLTIYSFYQQYFILASILYFISYSYDAFDGNYARKYNMVSKFGDYYDHFKDVSVNLLLLYVFYKYMTFKAYPKLIALVVAITIFLFITFNIHLGCQEIYVSKNDKKNKSGFLGFTMSLCHKNIYNNMHILRYFGNGVFALWICFLILLNKFF